MKSTICAFVLALLFPLAGCGGGGGGEEDGGPIQQTIPSTGNLDGNIAANSTGNVDVGGFAAIPVVGDDPFQMGSGSLVRQGVWSFDVSAIPPNATITTATLRLFVTATANDPAGMNVILRVDHVNFGAVFPVGPGALGALDPNFATISDLTTTGERLIDVTDQVQDDVDNLRGRSQYRVRGAVGTNNDGVADWVIFSDADNTANAAQQPFLLVTFTTP